MNDSCELSVVIPCLNEEKTLANCVSVALQAMREHGIAGEVVVSDNGSTDRSVELATQAGARVVNCPVRGYGAALQFGIRSARGTYVIMGDADESYDFGELPKFVERLRAGERFVMGSRLRGPVVPGAMPFLNRHLGTPVLTAVLNLLFSTHISDCNCGMRGIRRDDFLAIQVHSTGMEFASEMIIKAAIHEVPISEIPITLHRDKRDRPPHLRPWRDGWRHLRLILWYAPDHTMTLPGLVTLLVGLVLVLSQMAGPFTLGNFLFDIHFMILGLTLSMLGTSALSMGTAVHALMPSRSLRTARPFRNLRHWFTFDRAAMLAAFLAITGFLSDGYVLYHWLATHRGPLTPEHTRLSLFGLMLIAMAFQSLLLGFMVGSASSAFLPHAAPESGMTPEIDRRRRA